MMAKLNLSWSLSKPSRARESGEVPGTLADDIRSGSVCVCGRSAVCTEPGAGECQVGRVWEEAGGTLWGWAGRRLGGLQSPTARIHIPALSLWQVVSPPCALLSSSVKWGDNSAFLMGCCED